MARIRSFRPSFFLNEELAECNAYGRLLFIGLWCLADREGRLADKPKRIKAEVFPYEQQDVELLLEQLAQRGFIVRYGAMNEETGRIERFIDIPKFKDHQYPHKNEAGSKIPARVCDAKKRAKASGLSIPSNSQELPEIPTTFPAATDPATDPDPATVGFHEIAAAEELRGEEGEEDRRHSEPANRTLLVQIEQYLNPAIAREETAGLRQECIGQVLSEFQQRLGGKKKINTPGGLLRTMLRDHRECHREHKPPRKVETTQERHERIQREQLASRKEFLAAEAARKASENVCK